MVGPVPSRLWWVKCKCIYKKIILTRSKSTARPYFPTLPSSQNPAKEAVGRGARALFDFFGFLAFFDLLAEA